MLVFISFSGSKISVISFLQISKSEEINDYGSGGVILTGVFFLLG
jgi:hypothetical protein